MRLRPGEKEGDPAVLDAEPDGALGLSSSVVTSAAGTPEDVGLERPPGSADVRLSGTIPIGGQWDGELAVSDPAQHAVAALARALSARGIRVTGGTATTREPLPAGVRVLAAHESPPLAEIIRVVNKDSRNLHAEMLLRLVGSRQKGEGSAAKGHEAVVERLERLGISPEGWNLADGSGLARTNLVTPRGLVALLAAMERHPYAAAFRDSLAVAGRDGTLEKRMRGTAAEGNVAAKTGTLSLVNALAGYATTPRGERLAFVLMVNNHAGRGREALKALDDAAAAIAASR